MAFTLNGTGTKFYGEIDRAKDGSYTTTEWVVLAWMPIYPLRSWRVVKESPGEGTFLNSNRQYQVVAVPLNIPQVARGYALTGSVFGGIAFILFLGALNEPPSRRVDMVTGAAVFLVLATISFLTATVLAASQRVHWMSRLWLKLPAHLRRGLMRLTLSCRCPGSHGMAIIFGMPFALTTQLGVVSLMPSGTY